MNTTLSRPGYVFVGKLSQKRYLQEFKTIVEVLYKTTEAKNSDYADESDAFANFSQIEQLTNGIVPTEVGILTRMTDKYKRLASLMFRPAKVKESLTDTLIDLAVYCIILVIYLKFKNGEIKENKSPIDTKPLKEVGHNEVDYLKHGEY